MARKPKASNAVREAVAEVGGVAKAARLLNVRERTVERWRKAGRIPDAAAVLTLAKASGIRPERLAGLED